MEADADPPSPCGGEADLPTPAHPWPASLVGEADPPTPCCDRRVAVDQRGGVT